MRRALAGLTGASAALIGLGAYLLNLCTWSYAGICVRRDYAIEGFVLTVIGIVMAVTVIVMATALVVWLLNASPTAQNYRVRLFCTICGSRLRWVPAADRWYCSRCGQYRLAAAEGLGHHDA